MSDFKLTYSTMFNPPEELHTRFDAALLSVNASLGREFGMFINGKDVFTEEKLEDHSPINKGWLLGVGQKGNETHAELALQAARQAFPAWSRTPWQERVRILRKVVSLIEERLFDFLIAQAKITD